MIGSLSLGTTRRLLLFLLTSNILVSHVPYIQSQNILLGLLMCGTTMYVFLLLQAVMLFCCLASLLLLLSGFGWELFLIPILFKVQMEYLHASNTFIRCSSSCWRSCGFHASMVEIDRIKYILYPCQPIWSYNT